MIKYNNSNINDWYFADDNIIKVYRNNAVCYYKITSSGGTSGQTPCYAVVDDISQYQDTEFEDVFNKADGKWYKLNNLNQYEEYGVYGDSISSGSTSRLPSGYTEVEYVENQSLAYIDSGFKPNQDTRLVYTMQIVTQTPYGVFVGAGQWNKTNAIRQNYESGSLRISWGNSTSWSIYSSFPIDYNVHTYDWNKNEFYRDEILVGNSTYVNYQCTDNLGLLQAIESGATQTQDACLKGKLFSCKIYDNGTLVRDFIPCTRDSDSKVGVYDIVNNQFHTSAKSGYELIAGSAIPISSGATYYEGKLAIVDGYEYIYSGSSWVNVGEVSGSTASLPNVAFSVNYNAKNYDSNTKTLAKTSGQLVDVDAVITAGTPTVHDGYLTIASGTRATISGYSTYFNRTNSTPNITIISKHRTDGSNCHIFANRDSTYNWMYRPTSTKVNFHGSSQISGVAVTTQPVIASVRVDSNRLLTFNNYTDNTSTASSSFNYGSTNSGKFAMFQGYGTTTGENFVGDFYWVYMSQNTLTDDQVQQVIAYNEGGGGQPIYPLEYVVREDPPNNLTFSSMTEAEEYECPWVGMKATIDGDRYIFSGDSQSGYEWVEAALPYDAEIEYLQSSGTQYINTSLYLNTSNFEIGYNILGNRIKWGYTHQGIGGGTWVTVEPSTAFFGSYNNRFSITTGTYENVIKFESTNGLTVNNTFYSKTLLLGSDSIASIPLYVFVMYDFKNGMDYDTSGKLKSFYLKNDGELVLDMIPVRVGNVGYMYDKVSGQLFGNAGTGSFILGADK